MVTDDFELHEAEPSDAEPIYALYESLFRHHIEQIWGWDEAWQRANFTEEWQMARTWRVESQGRLAGYIQQKNEQDFVYLLSVAIIPDFQGRGIGRQIMAGFQDEAARLGQPLRLSVFRTNPRALSFYQGLDFRVTEETEAFHRLEWLPASLGEAGG
jgi:ribosomal protein S18 acetylase RimI-like enzyme